MMFSSNVVKLNELIANLILCLIASIAIKIDIFDFFQLNFDLYKLKVYFKKIALVVVLKPTKYHKIEFFDI
ncbi:UNVERIFIED_CONTAM: hypothetical protein NCL1_21272 [Trichonephila clavipes]